MKKHLFQIILFLASMTLFTSCLKDDPKNNKTVYYGYQQIPNINEYMPQELLRVMDSLNCLYYGDEPPRIEGTYIADSTYCIFVIHAPGSNWSAIPSYFEGSRRFAFKKQHVGFADLEYSYFTRGQEGLVIKEISTTDSTSLIMKSYMEVLVNESQCPPYFFNNPKDHEVFEHVYIIGHDPYFTIYYYDIRTQLQPGGQTMNDVLPLYANIISGRLEKDTVTIVVDSVSTSVVRTFIRDFRWGCQTVNYLNKGAVPTQIYNYHSFPKEGDGRIIKNLKLVQQEN